MDDEWKESYLVGFKPDNMRKRVRQAMTDIGYHPRNGRSPWECFCDDAGVPSAQALKAMNCTAGTLYEYSDTLRQLAIRLGRSLRWVITGESDKFSERDSMHALIDQYEDMAGVDFQEINELHRYLDEKIGKLGSHNLQAAYRKNLPQTVKDVAFLHDEMRQFQN